MRLALVKREGWIAMSRQVVSLKSPVSERVALIESSLCHLMLVPSATSAQSGSYVRGIAESCTLGKRPRPYPHGPGNAASRQPEVALAVAILEGAPGAVVWRHRDQLSVRDLRPGLV